MEITEESTVIHLALLVAAILFLGWVGLWLLGIIGAAWGESKGCGCIVTILVVIAVVIVLAIAL